MRELRSGLVHGALFKVAFELLFLTVSEGTFADMQMPAEDVKETFSYLVRSLREAHPSLAYLHITEPRVAGDQDRDVQVGQSNDFLKNIWLNGEAFLTSRSS